MLKVTRKYCQFNFNATTQGQIIFLDYEIIVSEKNVLFMGNKT